MIRGKTADVLIVGGGASGLAASMLLSRSGIDTVLVSRYPTTSNLPKASGLSIKTMEIFRELGIEDAIRAICTPPANMAYSGIYAGFGGDNPNTGRRIGRVAAWGRAGEDLDWRNASSVRPANLQQSLLEPIMKRRAEALAPGTVHFNHTLLTLEPNGSAMRATIEDRAAGETYVVDARYVLGCDGGRMVADSQGIELDGDRAVATSVSLHFSADLSRWYRDEDAFHTIILNPDNGTPCALLPCGPNAWGAKSREWVVHLMSFAGDHKLFDDDAAVAAMRAALGLPDIPIELHVINRWPLDAVVARRFRAGPVFLVGDAAHRMPPAGGNGLNTAIQDTYNLCWKLALVVKGQADQSLLDSYEDERRPTAQRIVATAYAGWHNNRALAQAIGFGPRNSAEQNWANLHRLWDGDRTLRRDVAAALQALVPNFDQLNVAFGYEYEAGAIVADGTVSDHADDPLAVFHPGTRPGQSMPDVRIEDLTDAGALGDLAGGGFLLLAGEAGHAWVDAARTLAERLGVAVKAYTIGGPDADWLDLRQTWRRVRGHGPEGAILVRPDRFVAWRTQALAPDCLAALGAVFAELKIGRRGV